MERRLDSHRRGIIANSFVQVIQVAEGVLDPRHQCGCVRVGHSLGQHLQARLTALQRIATFVSQPGDGLANRRQSFGLQQLFLRLLRVVMSSAMPA